MQIVGGATMFSFSHSPPETQKTPAKNRKTTLRSNTTT
jgi:hypothetical protein